ncbi:ABC-2 transporter permease [Priestia megaterium]|uniref:ABC-2 transporter permease n=1 Tax=Priestia megaterium TaxID=1404 RepID=UPI003D2DBE52
MLSLFRKDLIVLSKVRTLIIIAFYALIFGIVFNSITMGALFSSLYLILELINQDEKYDTRRYINSLPVKRNSIVGVKYIEGLIFGAVGISVMAIVGFIYSFIDLNFKPNINLTVIWGVFSSVLILSSLYFPFYFKFGKVAYYFVFIAIVAFLACLFYARDRTLDLVPIIADNLTAVKIFALILSAVLYVISYFISVKIYNTKEL